MPQDDLKIIESCLLGNTEEYSRIIDKYKGMVYNLAYRMCGNLQDSEDITQEAFFKTYQSLSHYNPSFRFSTWIYQITLNIIRDRLRKRNVESVSLDQESSSGKTIQDYLVSDQTGNPEDCLASNQQKEIFQQAINSLPVKYREIIILRHLQELSYSEIASVLKISPDAVKVRLFRAREQLKKILKK